MKNPKVTVLMSVYNGEEYLNEAIDSILGQTFKEFEFLIINDGSADKTGEILKRYNDPRIRILNNEENVGLTKSLNKGLKLARGEYIARQDADDISMPERLKKEVEFLEQNRNVGLVGTDYFMVNEEGEAVHIVKCLNGCRELKVKLLEGNQFGHGSVMFRRECIDNIGTYREEFKLAQDYDFYLRIAEAYDMANISEPLYNWRINIKSVSVKKKMLQDKYALLAIELAKERRQSGKDKLQSLKREEINNFLDSYLISKYEFPNKKEIAQNYCFWSKVLFDGKDYKGAFKLIFKSFISYPLNKETWVLAFKDLAILLFPKSIINVLRYIKRSIF
jgi:glycosyltransferase involved in cell wall biosynthesis